MLSTAGILCSAALALSFLLAGAACVSATIGALDDFGGSSTTVARAGKVSAVLCLCSVLASLAGIAQWLVWGVFTNLSSNPSIGDMEWGFWLALAALAMQIVCTVLSFISIRNGETRYYSEFTPLVALNSSPRNYL